MFGRTGFYLVSVPDFYLLVAIIEEVPAIVKKQIMQINSETEQ